MEDLSMANMSYCRFKNTKNDLGDCFEALRYEEELSKEEYLACKWMFEDIFNFFNEQGIIDSDDEWFDEFEERFDDFLKSVNTEED